MPVSRPLIAMSWVVTLVVATALEASARPAPKGPPPLCNLIVGDPNGQPSAFAPGSLLAGAPVPYQVLPVRDPALQVRSADVANDSKTVTVVFRMAKLSDSSPPTGRLYAFTWVWASSGVQAGIWARVGGQQGNAASKGARLVVDLKKNEIRVHQNIDLMSGHPLFAKGDRMTQLLAVTDLASPYDGFALTQGLYGHRAGSTKSYPLYAPSCVKVGV